MALSKTVLVLYTFAIVAGAASSASFRAPIPLQICARPQSNFGCTPEKPAGFFKECGLYKKGESCVSFCSYLMTKAVRCHPALISFLQYRELYTKCNYDCEQQKKYLYTKSTSKKQYAKVYVNNSPPTIAQMNCAVCVGCHKWLCHPACYSSCWW